MTGSYQLLTKLAENELCVAYLAYFPEESLEFLLKSTVEDDHQQSQETVFLYVETLFYKSFLSKIPELVDSIPEYYGSQIEDNNVQLFLEYFPDTVSFTEWVRSLQYDSVSTLFRVIRNIFTIILLFVKNSFIHYDLGNTDNILVTPDSSIKIIDFDWSKKYSTNTDNPSNNNSNLSNDLSEICNPALKYPDESILSYVDSYAVGRHLWQNKHIFPEEITELLYQIHPDGDRIFSPSRLTLRHFNAHPNSFYTAEEYLKHFASQN